jgi:hypothetical protein
MYLLAEFRANASRSSEREGPVRHVYRDRVVVALAVLFPIVAVAFALARSA